MEFKLSEEEAKLAKEWIGEQKLKHGYETGTFGGRWVYQFTPTGLGVEAVVIDQMTGERKELTDYSKW